jgi:PDZ domain-containing protein
LTDQPEMTSDAADVASAPPLPPQAPSEGWTAPPPPRRRSAWKWASAIFVVLLLVVVLAGFVIRLPYDTISPGAAIPVGPRITVTGAPTYPPKGSLSLLFVREQVRVNVWRYLQAKFDPDIDLVKNSVLNGNASTAEVNAQAVADMASSQIVAKKLALETAGKKVTQEPGAVVLSVIDGYPVSGVLRQGDVITAIDGHPVTSFSDVSNRMSKHKPGDNVAITYKRGSTSETAHVQTRNDGQGRAVLGVLLFPNYSFPVNISIDTSDIGGPSAGLAMTLALIDDLTPGNLTGGQKIAVTGTIASDGTVGEIGGIEQKAVAARAAHAQVFLVPKCSTSDPAPYYSDCQKQLAAAMRRAGSRIKVIPVGTLKEALAALRSVGGDPVTPPATAAPAAA